MRPVKHLPTGLYASMQLPMPLCLVPFDVVELSEPGTQLTQMARNSAEEFREDPRHGREAFRPPDSISPVSASGVYADASCDERAGNVTEAQMFDTLKCSGDSANDPRSSDRAKNPSNRWHSNPTASARASASDSYSARATSNTCRDDPRITTLDTICFEIAGPAGDAGAELITDENTRYVTRMCSVCVRCVCAARVRA